MQEIMASINPQSSYEELTQRKRQLRSYKTRLQDEIQRLQKSSPSAELKFRLAFCLLNVGQFSEALALLDKLTFPQARFLRALCLGEAGNLEEGMNVLESLLQESAPPSSFFLLILLTNFQLRRGRIEAVGKILEKYSSQMARSPETADTLYLRGLACELNLDVDQAMDHYSAALQKDDLHAEANFRLARLLDLYGEDEKALALYEKLVNGGRTHLGTLINLGLLYEDLGQCEKASFLYKEVMEQEPAHTLAYLYHNDAQASQSLFYDEQIPQRQQAVKSFLKTPVSETSLSLRARNVLEQIGIKTIDDLLQRTEEELNGYKTLGENALAEIKEMLSAKNLSLPKAEILGETQQAKAFENLLNQSLSEYAWSEKAKQFLAEKGFQRVEDLIQNSEKDLMAQTPPPVLQEVKQKLAQLGLTFQGTD